MKSKASTWKKVLGIVVVLVVLVAVVAAVFFRAKPMLDSGETHQVLSISADYEDGGETYSCTIEQADIPQELNDQLVALFQGAEMRNVRLFRPQSFTTDQGSVYFNIWVKSETESMLVNLSTNSDYISAQFGDTHYAIVDGQDLYQKVYGLVSPLLAEYAHKR